MDFKNKKNEFYIRMFNVSKSFGENKVLEDFNLNVKKGEFLTILGPSGCGKTTTLNLLAGFLSLDKGEIWIDDKNVSQLPSNKRNISMVFQNYALFPHMTVYDNIAFGLKVRKVGKNIIYNKVLDMLTLVGLDFNLFKDRYPHQLSGGEQQRISLARALIIEPKVLLLDEPLSNLDAKLRNEMRVEIKKIHDKTGVTIIYVTHDQEEALSISTNIILLNEGKNMQMGSPQQIYSNPKSMFVADFIGNSNFLKGKVSKILDDEATIKLSEGIEVNTFLQDFMKENIQVTIIIRDENIIIYKNKMTGKNVFKGKVKDNLYLGSFQRTYVQFDELKLSIYHKYEQSEKIYVKGETIFFKLDMQYLLVLPGEFKS